MQKHNLSSSSRNNLEGVKTAIILLIERSLKKSPYDFGIPKDGGKRTKERQQYLYSIGRTIELDKGIVTNLDGIKKKSIHQFGMAFDIFLYDDHGACWSCLGKYEDIAEVIKTEFTLMQKEGHFCKCEKLVWGGDWKSFQDLPHFQISKK